MDEYIAHEKEEISYLVYLMGNATWLPTRCASIVAPYIWKLVLICISFGSARPIDKLDVDSDYYIGIVGSYCYLDIQHMGRLG